MLKKSAVVRTIALGVMAAHVHKMNVAIVGAPRTYAEAAGTVDVMMDAIFAIDLGYSCSQEDLEAEIAKLCAEAHAPKEIATAMEAWSLMKEIEPLPPEEQGRLIAEKLTARLAGKH